MLVPIVCTNVSVISLYNIIIIIMVYYGAVIILRNTLHLQYNSRQTGLQSKMSFQSKKNFNIKYKPARDFNPSTTYPKVSTRDELNYYKVFKLIPFRGYHIYFSWQLFSSFPAPLVCSLLLLIFHYTYLQMCLVERNGFVGCVLLI